MFKIISNLRFFNSLASQGDRVKECVEIVHQCEQSAKGNGYHQWGACGKSPK
jgi:hypothetical protein